MANTHTPLPGGYMYDLGRDGSQVTWINGSTGALIQEFTAANLDELSNWSNTTKFTTGTDFATVACLFPQPRSVTAIHASGSHSSSSDYTAYVETSTDTTNGIDGGWTTAGTFTFDAYSEDDTNFRSNRLFTVGLNNIIGVRFRMWQSSYTNYLRSFIVWGTTELEGLVPWHATLDQPLSNDTGELDRGDILVTAPTLTQQFRLKNTSLISTASTVVIATDATSSFGSLADETTFSLDNTNFQQSITIPSVAPDTISPVVYMRRATPTDLAGTIRVCTVRATVTSWA